MVGSRAKRRRELSPWARKRRRMYVAVSILVLLLVPLLLWRVSLARDVRQALAALESASLPVSLAQLNERLPDLALEDNRASLYYEARDELQEFPQSATAHLPFFGGTPLPGPAEPLDPDVMAAMAAAIETNSATLAALHDAATRPSANYLVRYGVRGSADSLSYLPGFTRLVWLLCYESLLGAEEGDAARAYQSLHTAIALTESLEHLGFDVSLRFQWELEAYVIETLERLLHGPRVPDATLAPLVAQFRPGHREAVYRHVVETEQALFVARIREGRHHSILKGLVLAAGVGDLNLRAYLAAGDLLLAWPGADYDRRTELERAHAAKKRAWEESPLLYATLLYYPPPAPTRRIKDELDHAAVVSVALAATRYRWATGHMPDTVAHLAPEYLDAVPKCATTGEPVALLKEGVGVDAVRFRLPD